MAKPKRKAKTQKQELTTPSFWDFNWLDVDEHLTISEGILSVHLGPFQQ